MTPTLQVVELIAAAYDRTLKATDKRFRRAVQLTDKDGSVLFFRNAFLAEYVDNNGDSWIICFPEHHNVVVKAADELLGYKQFEVVHTKPTRIKKPKKLPSSPLGDLICRHVGCPNKPYERG